MLFRKLSEKNIKNIVRSTRRHFFNPFGGRQQDKRTDIAKINQANQSTPFKPVPKKSSERELTDVEKYYLEYRKEREREEQSLLKRQREIEELSDRVRREAEVTLQTIDYKSIIISNINIIPQSEFTVFEEFQKFLENTNLESKRLTEENCMKIIRGFLTYADKISMDYVYRPNFLSFQTNLASSLSYFHSTENFADIAKFMDLFCIDYEDLWGALETQVQTKMPYMNYNVLVSILVHFSNQNEGTPKLYDSLESKFIESLKLLTTSQIVDICVGYFNHRMGTKQFMDKMLKRLKEKLDDHLVMAEMNDLVKIALILVEVNPEYDLIVKELYKSIEENVLECKEKLDFTITCYLAKGFGFDNGSPKLFKVFDQITKPQLDNIDLQNLMNYIAGFLYTYRISESALDVVIQKIEHFLPSISIGNLAKITKSLYILERDQNSITKKIEGLIINALKHRPQEIPKEELFEVAFSYCLTRLGSRELYRLLELALIDRLKDFALDKQLFEKLIEIYEKSGLCTTSFIHRMRVLN